MPVTPMERNRSFTSSSLNGLMIASIFFMGSPRVGRAGPGEASPRAREPARALAARLVVVVAGLAVIGAVEPGFLTVGLRPQADHRLDDRRQHDGADDRPRQREAN